MYACFSLVSGTCLNWPEHASRSAYNRCLKHARSDTQLTLQLNVTYTVGSRQTHDVNTVIMQPSLRSEYFALQSPVYSS